MFRSGGARRLRRVLQPHGAAYQLRRVCFQQLRRHQRRPYGPGSGGGFGGYEDTFGSDTQSQAVRTVANVCGAEPGLTRDLLGGGIHQNRPWKGFEGGSAVHWWCFKFLRRYSTEPGVKVHVFFKEVSLHWSLKILSFVPQFVKILEVSQSNAF